MAAGADGPVDQDHPLRRLQPGHHLVDQDGAMDRSSPGFGAAPRIGRSRLVGWHGPLTGKEWRDVRATPGTGRFTDMNDRDSTRTAAGVNPGKVHRLALALRVHERVGALLGVSPFVFIGLRGGMA
jgi:hypothetical protein